ncbi:MAG TPA: polysaccharide deacetylase family protein, partial [Caldilineaceae bacterium]|nr:polysaccharide deacetylase family protein [Caldilineaceae bacterium]
PLTLPTATHTSTATPSNTATPTSPQPDVQIRALLNSPLPTPLSRFTPAPVLVVEFPLLADQPSNGSATPGNAQFLRVPDVGATLPLTVVHPTLEPTPDGAVRTAQVPILMYHYLSEPPADADIYRRDLSVTPALFAEHLARIKSEGYTTISLYDLVAYLNQGAPLPPKPVILTFDDGYRDNYENAFPLLVAHEMKATFFIVTDFIDAQRPEYLSWEMVRAMYAAGMSIESHGRNHVSLRGKDSDYLVWQALGSMETIQYELGVRPRFVSYPAGEYDDLTLEIFQQANYWGGVTTVQGATHTSDNLFELRRVRIHGTTSADELARLLALDW